MKHMTFKDFLKEEVSSADVASVETKLNLAKEDEVKEAEETVAGETDTVRADVAKETTESK